MQQIHTLEKIAVKNTWITIGVFDGVHLGHQKILHRLVDVAHKEKTKAIVITFDPHPAVILGGRTDFKYLTPSEEKMRIFESLGIDITLTLPFTRSFAEQTAEEFMQLLTQSLGLKHLVIGYDTALGKERQGDVKKLGEIGNNLGYEVEVIPPVADGEGIISSTRISKLLSSGQVAEASQLLGRYYTVEGCVIHGDGRGRKLNFPTANIQVSSDKCIPVNGIYACWVIVDGMRHPAATSIGTRPTFEPDERQVYVESFLLDFQGDLYDKYLQLEFVKYLRSEQKFPTVNALVEQMKEDVRQTRSLLTPK